MVITPFPFKFSDLFLLHEMKMCSLMENFQQPTTAHQDENKKGELKVMKGMHLYMSLLNAFNDLLTYFRYIKNDFFTI